MSVPKVIKDLPLWGFMLLITGVIVLCIKEIVKIVWNGLTVW